MTLDTKAYWEHVGPPMAFGPERWTYEQKRAFRYNLQYYMREVFPFEEFAKKSILDIGCGAGLDLAEFARNGAFVIGVDFSKSAINSSTALFAAAGLPGTFRQADATALPFPDARFDAAFSFGVLHHIPNVNKALSEIARVLKPKGQFMGMVYHKDSLLYAHSILARGVAAGLTPQEAMCAWSERTEGCPYSVAYTRQELADVLSRHFMVKQIEPKFAVIDLPHKRKVRFDLAEGDAEAVGWHLIFKAEKA